jgi:outer membrane receptor protein involved in Fe transport
MATFQIPSKQLSNILLGAVVSFASLQMPTALAQGDELVLEEIIVTAQRREQSLQEVPIAIEVFSGNEIRRQGFRDLDDLANFSPTVLIEPRVQDQDVSIRGFGTTGNALTLDQAAPFFIDGIHFGRQSQVKLAFLDIESLEVLKGPQPVYFGQNATAGAFNIRSRRPTETWEGYVNAEFGSNQTQELTFAAGGPLNDQWGIRAAAMHETSDGYMTYVVTGTPYGAYENTGGRLMLQFTPNDRLEITGKVEASKIRKDSETISTCRTAGPLIFGRGGPLDDPNEYDPADPVGDERSVWGAPEIDPANPGINTGGAEWDQPFIPLPTDCFSNELSVSEGGPYYEPPQTIREENSNVGSVDIRAAAEGAAREGGNNGILGYEDIDALNGYVDIVYSFENEMSFQWLTGFASYERDYVQDNSDSPFLMNFQGRGEDFEQVSSEIRFRSAPGGTFEWEAGAFFQSTDLTAFSNSLRSNVRQSQRSNIITEEVDFSAIFGTVTFNLGDRFSIDVGGRYQDHDKFATAEGYAASWIFTVCPANPCDLDPATAIPSNMLFDPSLYQEDANGDVIEDGYAGTEGCVRRCDRDYEDRDLYYIVDPAFARMYLDVPAGTTLYAMPFRETRNVPEPWWSGNTIPVGLTLPDFARRGPSPGRGEGPWAVPFVESGFSPQVTLRFRAGENLTFYARYAESTKIGGFDTGQTSIPRDLDELTFETEDAEQWELGVKGTLGGGRFAFDADLFELEFPNLQTTALSPDPEQTSASVNAGQRVRGIEFNMRFAATDNLRLGFAGALMDGEMTSFPGAGCTDAEIFAALSDASAPCKIFDGDVLQVPPIDAEEALDDFTAIINRTGTPAPRTPDWKFVLTADYWVPLGTNYELTFNAKGYVSDGYILDVESFDDVVNYDQHEDLNLMIGLRNVEKGWSISAFGRSLLEARPTYHAAADVFPNGLQSQHLSPSSFASYGVKFEYLFD